jgi:hypothetical protein
MGDFLMVHLANRLAAAVEGGPLQGLPGTFVFGTGGLLNWVLLTIGDW